MNLSNEGLAAMRARRLAIREAIRNWNEVRPRCAGCGCDFPVHRDVDLVTPVTPGVGDYLAEHDFRPGDLVCFWCLCSMVPNLDQQFNHWGHA